MKQSDIVISRHGVDIITIDGLQTETARERLGGLLVKNKLKDREGLWLTPCNSVHTFGMKYSLDLVYVDKNNEVCGTSEDVKPWRMSLCFRAQATIELVAGSISRFGIQKGDNCIWVS